MTAIANSGTQAADVYAITQQLSRMGSASASKMLGISVSDYERLGASGAAQYYQNRFDANRFGYNKTA